jgi:hypothetical protein
MKTKIIYDKKEYGSLLIIFWAFFSFIGVAIGKKFEVHYFHQIIPVFSILGGYGISQLLKEGYFHKILNNYGKLVVILFIILATLFPFQIYHGSFGFMKRYYYLFTKKSSFISKEERVAKLIKEQSLEKDIIFVWGNSPQIYFLSNRTPASRLVFNNVIVQGYFPKKVENKFLNIMMEDLNKNMPTLFIDAVPFDERAIDRFNISHYPELSNFLSKNYEYLHQIEDIIIYRIKKG